MPFKTVEETEMYTRCNAATRAGLVYDELDVCMAELQLDHLKDFSFTPYPTEPNVLRRFRDDKKTEAWKEKSGSERAEIYRRIYGKDIVKDYIETKWKLVQINLANASYLERLVDLWVKWGDKSRAKQCWDLYNLYPEEIGLAENIMWRKKKWKNEANV